MVEKSLRIRLIVLTECMNVTDKHRMTRGKNWWTFREVTAEIKMCSFLRHCITVPCYMPLPYIVQQQDTSNIQYLTKLCDSNLLSSTIAGNQCCVIVRKWGGITILNYPVVSTYYTTSQLYKKQILAVVYLQHEHSTSDHQFEITQCKADDVSSSMGIKQCCKNAQNTSCHSSA